MAEDRRGRTAYPREVNCAICGVTFIGNGVRSTFCPTCKKERARAYAAHYRRKKQEERRRTETPDSARTRFAKSVPKCPFWRRGEGVVVACEGGTITTFETRKERTLYIAEWCAKNPEWQNCPIAKKILLQYEEG